MFVSICFVTMMIVPPQEGGVNYKNQFQLIQVANLALIDEIKKLDTENKYVRKKLEVSIGNYNRLNSMKQEAITTREG